MDRTERKTQWRETLIRIEETISDLHVMMNSMTQKQEDSKKQNFKDELLRKKQEFENINITRSENMITNNIMAEKKALERECATSLKKSMEASRTYELLKQKLNSIESQEVEMQLESRYLEKKIKRQSKKNKALRGILAQVQENTFKSRVPSSQASERSFQNSGVLAEKPINKLPNLNNFREESRKSVTDIHKKLLEETQKRLKLRIQCGKDHLTSLIFTKSDVESIFEPFLGGKRLNNKEKLLLGEEILNDRNVKRQLYQLIFQN